MDLNKIAFRILIIDEDIETQKDFIKILSEQTKQNEELNILSSQIFGERHTANSYNKSNYPKFEIKTASQSIEGIELIKKSHIQNLKFTMIFLDVYMPPGNNRIETIHQIWQIDPDIQIVICYGNTDQMLQEEFTKIDAIDNLLILQKPLNYIVLRQLAYNLSKKWLLIQESKDYNLIIENYVQERTENLIYQATHDPLTKLRNRNELDIQLKKLIASAERNNSMFGVLFLDLDEFKLINDTYSHEIGDEVLKNVTKRIQNKIRNSDLLFRIGGDEFVMLAPELKNEQNLATISQNLLKIIEEPINLSNISINLRISIGISLYPKHGKELLHKADLAMYEAKRLGGNQITIFNQTMHKSSQNCLTMDTELTAALNNNELFLCYLPIIDLNSEKLIAIEALLQWRHPQLGILSADAFLPNLNNLEIKSKINNWIIKNAISHNKFLQTQGYPPLIISINMQTEQIKQKNLSQIILNYLDKFQLSANYFSIEIAENTLINDPEVFKVMTNLKKLGIQIIIDSFGCNNIPLRYLKKLQGHYLKIDISSINNIDYDNNNHNLILGSIIKIANNLKIKAISVGIETTQHKTFFENHDLKLAQNHYLIEPLSLKDLEKLLASNKEKA